ncbi:class I SAM-dependent methyltransferase [Aliiroseovarius sp. S1339]|uniref:class I SAM-dependent methyltransferase n=1 Tax=Aliiroseovarius sp. S1339 TaxID=2936990 RepID=UPI0020BD47C4|nr:class I SAM-dependent methyltransferase [Aliiroseovarius sp. S1339]MCK8465169.1 class I SAM-dependent methyltransferase [Aliiroseovarius sp. S1339]
MITFEQLMQATTHPRVASLNTGAFSPDDIANIILQRSEILGDQRRPGQAIKAWSEGNEAPVREFVEKMGDTLVRRAAAIIWLEYLELKPTIDTLSPKSVADIGCGYSFFDLFLWQDHAASVLLIDIETSEERHFGFKKRGAAYSNLNVAQRFLEANGVARSDIACCNPDEADLSAEKPVDLAVSFISCGFHYPVETYLDFFRNGVKPSGAVILDVRSRKLEEATKFLQDLGDVSVLTKSAHGKADRIMVAKQPPASGTQHG